MSIFVGSSEDVYVFTLTDGKKTFQLEPIINQSETHHGMLLEGLIHIMKASKNVHLVYYSNHDHLAFEWEREYKQEKQFSKGTDDLKKWNKVIELAKKNNILLTVKGEEDVLTGVCRRLDKEARKYGSGCVCKNDFQ